MDEIIDGATNYPLTDPRIRTDQITVKMAGEIGYQAVTSPPVRPGQASISGNLYNIDLPGLQTGSELEVDFRRR